jgi:hypothetical protein
VPRASSKASKGTIVDFEQGIDVINLRKLDVDFSDLVIREGNVVTIDGIDLSDLAITMSGATLTESDFLF